VEPLPPSSDEGVNMVPDELSGTRGLSVGATGHTVLHVSHSRCELRGEEFRTVGELQGRRCVRLIVEETRAEQRLTG
jgi:hypothetical protein